MTSIEPFLDKRILVTGGTSGIGAAVAEAFAARGAAVEVLGKDEADVGEWRERNAVTTIRATALDVADGAAIAAVVNRFDRLDCLINCAGMLVREGREFEPEVFQRVLDVNLTGMMRMCVACKPVLARSRGAIVNIASMLSFFGGAHAPAYSASKGGVVQLTKSLAIAWAGEGIRVNAVAPGWIATALTQAIRENPGREQAILDRTPMKRWGTPAEVAGPVLFLCSAEASFITGATLPIDGGYLAM